MVDQVLGEPIELRPTAVVLSAGIVPHEGAAELAALLKVPLNGEGQFLEAERPGCENSLVSHSRDESRFVVHSGHDSNMAMLRIFILQ